MKKHIRIIMLVVALASLLTMQVMAVSEDVHVHESNEALRIGWGCPLEGMINQARYNNTILSQINYFLPISEMVAMLSAWLIAIAAYYMGSIVMRWVRVIS